MIDDQGAIALGLCLNDNKNLKEFSVSGNKYSFYFIIFLTEFFQGLQMRELKQLQMLSVNILALKF